MKVTTDENGDIVLKEIYSGVFLETSEGNRRSHPGGNRIEIQSIMANWSGVTDPTHK